MLILGITGGIATGKSAVTQMLAELGAPTVSADILARSVLAPGTETTQAVLSVFPSCADPDHSTVVNRRALAALVFADDDARRRLESLMHPPIVAALRSQFALWRALPTPCAGAGEIPLLLEAGLESLVDKIVVAACDGETQTARLMTRDGADAAEAERRIAAQWPLAEKIARADVVIDTGVSLEETRRQVEALWASLQV